MKYPLLGEIVGPNSPKYCQILLKFSPQLVFKEKKTVLQEFLKNSHFYRNRRYPEFPLLVQLWPLFSPEEDGEIKNNNNNFGGKKFTHWAIQK